jgi:5-methylcytosine-specific restriction protein A
MSEKKKRLPWRCKNQQQAKDKATIYNSREWKELRIQKLRANPLCERCEQQGFARSAHSVHHITPIETAATMGEMRRLAFNPANLMSLCDECHHKIHEEMRSFDLANVKARAEARQARWADNLMQRFVTPNDDEPPTT